MENREWFYEIHMFFLWVLPIFDLEQIVEFVDEANVHLIQSTREQLESFVIERELLTFVL